MHRFTLPKYRSVIFWVLALLVFYAISRYNYNLFHSLTDGISIVIATCVFVIIWNSRHLVDNHFFLYTGIAFLFFAFLDLMHVLGNKNMGVFPEYGNLGPAFYIASRYILSISLLIAPLFINRKLNVTLMFVVYSSITSLILLSVFYWQIFPVCIIEGSGLTPFKVVSDYIICLILLGAIGLLLINRRSFDSRVLSIIITSIILSIATGLAFTLYADPFGVTNTLGHLLQISSFYLVYIAYIDTSLTKPQEILFRKLKQNEEKLAKNLEQLDYSNSELQQEIAKHKRTEEALRESEQRYRMLFDSMTEGFAIHEIITDEQGTPVDYRFLDINPAFERLTGLKRREVVGKTLNEVLPGDDPKWLRMYGAVALTGEPVQFENYSPVLKRYYEVTAHCPAPRQFAVIFMDITERKQVEEDLRKSERLYRAIGESIEYGIWVCDPDGRNTYTSDSFLNLVGLTHEHCLDFGWGDALHPDDAERTMAAWKECVRTGGIWDIEHRFRGVDGQWHPVLARGVPVRNEQGKVVCWAGINLDISRLKKVETSLKERTQQLEDANKELESFSYSVSHDLRAPLRAIEGYSRIILQQQGEKLDENTKRKFDVIRNSIKTMGQLIDDLLALSRLGKEALSLSQLNMEDLTRSVWEELKDSNPHRAIDLKIDHIPPGIGDRSLIKQVLVNILSNAIKFTKVREVPLIEVGGYVTETENVYYVRDNGVGFSMQYHDKLFGVFQRLHSGEDYEGTGVGLAIVQRIVRRHGGRIWAEGKVDEGACFYFTLQKA